MNFRNKKKEKFTRYLKSRNMIKLTILKIRNHLEMFTSQIETKF